MQAMCREQQAGEWKAWEQGGQGDARAGKGMCRGCWHAPRRFHIIIQRQVVKIRVIICLPICHSTVMKHGYDPFNYMLVLEGRYKYQAKLAA